MKIVNESLNEFERGLDPKKALNIGLLQSIKKWLDENDYNLNIEDQYIYHILNDQTLTSGPGIDWAKYLIANGYVWHSEYGSDIWYLFGEHGIDPLDYVPNGWKLDTYDSIYLRKAEDKFYLEFEDWPDFSIFIERNSPVNAETFRKIMEGDIYKYYNYYGTDKEVLQFMRENKESIPSFDNIKQIYAELEGTEDDEDGILIDIFDNNIFSYLKDNIIYTFEEYDRTLYEDSLVKNYIKIITKHFELTGIYYDEKDKCYIANISKKGANTLLNNFLASEDLIYLRSEDPYYDSDLKLFDEILCDRLYT